VPKDYYEVLGVPRTATDTEIKRAFRQRARELHPDVNTSPDATRQFQRVNEAYQVLGDPSRRSTYDRTGSTGRVRVRTARRPAAQSATRARPASSTHTRPDWSQPGPSSTYHAEPHPPYRYSWQKPRAPQIPSWVPWLARLVRYFVGSPFFWVFIIVQFVAILALPTGAPVLGSEGWTIVWLASFALPVVAIVIGVRKAAE
jgi:curved DNA-binding protein CbpA